MKRKISIVVLSMGLFAALLLGVYVFKYWHALESFPKTLSSFHAKMFCSCYFVMEQSQDYCEKFTEYAISASSYELDEKAKSLVSYALGSQAKAEFRSQELGCRISSQ